MKKLLIVDGSALLFQSFFGMPRQITAKSGERIEAVICFFGILRKTIEAVGADMVFVIFDGENELLRKEIDEDYKANRPDLGEDNPFGQLALIRRGLSDCGIKNIETDGVEADDFIAGIVRAAAGQVEAVISSPDKDFWQLIDDTTSVFTYRGKVSKHQTKDTFFTQFGFSASLYNIYKSLTGDPSDNIKGIAGIGSKRAAELTKATSARLGKSGENVPKTDNNCAEETYKNQKSFGEVGGKKSAENLNEAAVFDAIKEVCSEVKFGRAVLENWPKIIKNFALINLKNARPVEVDFFALSIENIDKKSINFKNALKANNIDF